MGDVGQIATIEQMIGQTQHAEKDMDEHVERVMNHVSAPGEEEEYIKPGTPEIEEEDEPEKETVIPGFAKSSHVFLDLAQPAAPEESAISGRLIFQLFEDVAPKTCANFRALCCGTHTKEATRSRGALSEELRDRLAHISRTEVKERSLTMEGSHIFRVVAGEAIFGGDITAGNGISGGCSVYGGAFADETYDVEHGTAGVLSMAPLKPGENTSLFRISLRPMPELQGEAVAFGQLIHGLDVLRMVADTKVVGGTAYMPHTCDARGHCTDGP